MNGQKFIARNRAPRIQLEYDVELYGAERKVQLPLVVGVLADLSGRPKAPLPGVGDRKFLEISVDNFDDRMKVLLPRVAFQVEDLLSGAEALDVELTFESMDDFSPAAIVRRIAPLKALGDARQQLSTLVTYMEGKAEAERRLGEVLLDTTQLAWLASVKPGHTDHKLGALTGSFKPQSERARAEVVLALQTMAACALQSTGTVGNDVVVAITSLIAEIDAKLSRQLNLILHHADFQALEGAWRGLYYLVNNTETDQMLKIRLLSISKRDLYKTLHRFKGPNWDHSPIFKKLYEDEFGQLGGEPYGCLLGDYFFDHSPPDVEVLGEMARIAAAIHAPFIAGAAPATFQMESWQELGLPRNLGRIFNTPEYAGWRSLRESEDARYLALAMPRFLARLPYGRKTNPVEEFAFEEEAGGANGANYTWANTAYAMGANITRAFKLYGWCVRINGIDSGGAVEGLPSHVFPSDDGSPDRAGPTEVAITDRREAELAQQGFMPLVQRKSAGPPAFIGAQSLQKPATFDDPDATANANLAARLPYLFATCRFAHYLMCIARDKIGRFYLPEELQKGLQTWINQYVDSDPHHSSEDTKARRPLAAAEVVVQGAEGAPGRYVMKLFLRPHYQLAGLTVSLRLIAQLPSAKGP